MKIAFYKGDTRLFNRLCSWYLRSPYSHCELVLGQADENTSLCASASYMDGGVRVKKLALDPAKWDVVEIAGSPQHALGWATEHEDERYDTLGLFGFFWRRQSGEKRKWFCSEAVAAMLGFDEPWRFDPATLYNAVTRKV